MQVSERRMTAYIATADPFQPAVLAGEAGYSVNAFYVDGEIVGVAVYDDDGKFVTGAGLLPLDVRG